MLTLAAIGLTQRGFRNQALAVMMQLDNGLGRSTDEVADALVNLCLALDEAGLGISCNIEPLLDVDDQGHGDAAHQAGLHALLDGVIRRGMN